MSCAGCNSKRKADEEAITKIRTQAKKYAVDLQKDVIIYLDRTGKWAYMEAQAARNAKIRATGGMVSHLQPVTV